MNIRTATMADLKRWRQVEAACFPAAKPPRRRLAARLRVFPTLLALEEDGNCPSSTPWSRRANDPDEMYADASCTGRRAWQAVFA